MRVSSRLLFSCTPASSTICHVSGTIFLHLRGCLLRRKSRVRLRTLNSCGSRSAAGNWPLAHSSLSHTVKSNTSRAATLFTAPQQSCTTTCFIPQQLSYLILLRAAAGRQTALHLHFPVLNSRNKISGVNLISFRISITDIRQTDSQTHYIPLHRCS